MSEDNGPEKVRFLGLGYCLANILKKLPDMALLPSIGSLVGGNDEIVPLQHSSNPERIKLAIKTGGAHDGVSLSA